MTAGGLATAAAALGAVLGLIWVLQRLARGRLRPVAGRRLQLTETIPLDARRRLHLVRCGERSLLIQTGGPNDLVIGWVHEAPGEQA